VKISHTPLSPLAAIVPLVSRDMVRARTCEHARHDGRAPHEIKQSDYERAKRELTGESDSGLQQAIFSFSDDLHIGPESEGPPRAWDNPT
jgi:hypothetical protein